MSLMVSTDYQNWMEFSPALYINQGIMHRFGLTRFAENANSAVIALNEGCFPSAVFWDDSGVTALVNIVGFQQSELDIGGMCLAAMSRLKDGIDFEFDAQKANFFFRTGRQTERVMREIDAAHDLIRKRMHLP